MEERKQFTFYASFHKAAQALQVPEERGALYEAICNYALCGTEPQLSGAVAGMFELIRPNLDASRRKAENRLGKKQSENKQKTNQQQNEKKREKKKESESKSESESEKENEYYVLGGAGGNDSSPADKPPGSQRFTPPSVEDVRAYCEERHNGIDPQRFVDFYEAKGWMLGKNKMKNWKAAVRTWEQRENGKEKELSEFDKRTQEYEALGWRAANTL